MFDRRVLITEAWRIEAEGEDVVRLFYFTAVPLYKNKQTKTRRVKIMCRTTNNELVSLADNKAQLYKDIWGWGAQGYTGPALSGVQLQTVCWK